MTASTATTLYADIPSVFVISIVRIHATFPPLRRVAQLALDRQRRIGPQMWAPKAHESRSRVLVVRQSLRERPYFWRASQNEKREWNEIEPHNSLRKSADASGEAEGPPLLVPIKRQPRVVHELSCCELRQLVAVEDRADNIGGQ